MTSERVLEMGRLTRLRSLFYSIKADWFEKTVSRLVPNLRDHVTDDV